MKQKIPQKLSLVKFDFTNLPKQFHKKYPFKPGETYLFLGEIVGMKGHCVVAEHAGKVHFGYHTDNFIQLSHDEL